MRTRTLIAAVYIAFTAHSAKAQQAAPSALFTLEEVVIPMRDGAHLQTAILRPVGRPEALPILLRRTPYGVPATPPNPMPPSLKELANDGYIFVIQNLRGRFKSVVSLTFFGDALVRSTWDESRNVPSDLKRPRRFWMTKM